MGEGDDPPARRGDDAELIVSSETTCRYDGQELVDEMPSLLPGIVESLTRRRRCPKCGRRFSSSPMTDFAAGNLSQLFKYLSPMSGISTALSGGSVPTLPRIERAQIETGKLEKGLDDLQARLDAIQEELPAPNRAIAEVREHLGGFESRLGDMGRSLEEAKQEFLGLIPDATDLAYLKLAKADVAEVRNVLTRHIDEHGRRVGAEQNEGANRRAWIALALSGVGLIVAIVSATQ